MADIYEKFTLHVLELPTANTPVKFPVPEKYGEVPQPEAIMVQSLVTNTKSIVVGKSNVQADFSFGGWEIPVGADAVLPTNTDEVLYAVSSADNHKLLITYLRGKQ